ncbi:replication initiation protein RepC [uncultured Ruegeria sp.]|uniref:replication initiation protein RepC n=1 Tax=uncultured Ruegeria sp. TaxID=259304 RepID=UPI00261AD3AA|nr:replication initiation protein RepC [uncultured Ruegeria sp.]
MNFRHVATAQAQPTPRYHNGLPEGWNRDRFRQLCVVYAQIRGVSAQCIRTLEIIIDMISPTAFRDVTQDPFCYARQETLIAERGLTDKTIYNHELELERIGLVARRLGANGSRCKRKGLGLYLTPALNLIPDMQDAQQRDRAAKQDHDALRGDRSRLYRYLKITLTTLAALPRPPEAVDALIEEFRSWPRSDKLKYMTLDRLTTHVQAAHDLWKRTEAFVNKPTGTSGQPEDSFGCHIQDKIEDKILSCNAKGEIIRPSAHASEPVCSGSGPDGPPRCLEKNNAAGRPAHKTQKHPRVSNRLIYELASEELRMHIDIHEGGTPNPNPSLYSIEAGAKTRMNEIGTNSSAWNQAIDTLGLEQTIVAALITDARLTDPKLPRVGSPGGYFRSMIKAHQKDDLNLIGSLMGLMARRAKEEETPQ